VPGGFSPLRFLFVCLLAVAIVALAIEAKHSQYHDSGKSGHLLSKAIKMDGSRVQKDDPISHSPSLNTDWGHLRACAEAPPAAGNSLAPRSIQPQSPPILV